MIKNVKTKFQKYQIKNFALKNLTPLAKHHLAKN